jgi:hypothetical protein
MGSAATREGEAQALVGRWCRMIPGEKKDQGKKVGIFVGPTDLGSGRRNLLGQ